MWQLAQILNKEGEFGLDHKIKVNAQFTYSLALVKSYYVRIAFPLNDK